MFFLFGWCVASGWMYSCLISIINMIKCMDDGFLFVVGTFYVSTVCKYRQCWFGNFCCKARSQSEARNIF